jgi:dephospho-CoA kinase
MLVIGLVGGIASGKSRVAEQFERLGATVLRADAIGHEILRRPEVEEALRRRWGKAVFDSHGRIDRSAVAQIVFGSTPEHLQFLESVTHPLIGQVMHTRLVEIAGRGDIPAVVLDAAVLLEAGWNRFCDRIVFVDAKREQQIERACRRGWSVTDLASREAVQLSLEEKRKVADWVIDNSGTIDHTFAQVKQFWNSLDLPPPE